MPGPNSKHRGNHALTPRNYHLFLQWSSIQPHLLNYDLKGSISRLLYPIITFWFPSCVLLTWWLCLSNNMVECCMNSALLPHITTEFPCSTHFEVKIALTYIKIKLRIHSKEKRFHWIWFIDQFKCPSIFRNLLCITYAA